MVEPGRFDNLAHAIAVSVLAIVFVHVALLFKRTAHARRSTKRRLGLASKTHRGGAPRPRVYGFYHPTSADGGGGERVLWAAIDAVQRRDAARRASGEDATKDDDDDNDVEKSVTVVYTSSNLSGEGMIARAKARFGITIRGPIHTVKLTRERWTRAETYGRCTIAKQALGSVALGVEALSALTPDVFIDTVGHAAIYPLSKYIFRCKTVAYVHYPTVSSDMIERVREGRVMYNNSGRFAASKYLTGLKVLYYRAFSAAYGWCGKSCSCVMVNSSWTKAHIDALWGVNSQVVYPPCNVEDLTKLPLTRQRLDKLGNAAKKENACLRVISVGQFRPEKAHLEQVAAWAALKKVKSLSYKLENAILVFVGGCRDDGDRERLKDLKQSVKDLELEKSVEFVVDASYDELKRQLSRASVGIHSMIDEHFGICVVEYMAAGAVPVAHASGGPLMDIVVDSPEGPTGYTALSVQEYADFLQHLLMMSRPEREVIAARARKQSLLFTEEKFRKKFIDALAAVDL